jgi:hypothetical protein
VSDRLLSRSSTSFLAAFATTVLAGCGGPYDASVSGVATLDSAPLSRGVVSFTPTASGASAYGQIGADGKYQVWTGREEGLASGDYVVSVVSTEDTGDRGKGGGPPPLGKSITPDWYRDPNTSGLNFTVASGENEINLELKSTPPPGWKPPPGRR